MATLASRGFLCLAFFVMSLTGREATSQTSHAAHADTRHTSTHAPDYEEDAWRVLWLGLHNPKAGKRAEAVKALSLMQGNRKAVQYAIRAIQDPNALVRASAASTLGELHAVAAVPALKAALLDKEITVMLAAAHALYVLKDPAAYEIYYAILMGDKKTSTGLIQAQVDRLKDPKQVVEMGFQEGLGFVPYAGMGYEAYRTLMKHDNSPVRAAAARFLALDPDPVSEDALVQTALADNNVIVREAAIDALAQKDDPRCIELLAKNLHENLYAVRYRTAATIIRVGRTRSRKTVSN
jgi:HEAT repeat protein